MQRLFLFLYQYRAFLTFLFLEAVCSWLIIENNQYQGAKFFNSSAHLAANLLQTSNNVSDYFELKQVNERLAGENAELKEELQRLRQSLYSVDVRQLDDEEILNQYDYISAKVINNSTRRFNNYITINKGKNYDIAPGMAVVSNDGVVGKVKAVSKHFSVITSILHVDVMVSAKIERTGDLATVKWDGIDPYSAKLKHVPRHVEPQPGDTIVTSGYNAIFPQGIPVGVIKEVELQEEKLFYEITITLASDLNKLSYVYLIRNNLEIEQDSLETKVEPF